MNALRLLIASTTLTCFALFPDISQSEDDLEVTMIVFDDISKIDDALADMQVPDMPGPADAQKADDDGGPYDDDDFADYDDFDGDDDLLDEDDFDEGEEIDDDIEDEEKPMT